MKKIFKPIIILLALLSLIKINYAYGSDSLYQYSPALFKGGEKALSLMIEQRVSFKDKSYKHIEHGNCNLLFKLSAKGSIDNITYFDLPDSCFFAESIALWLYNDCISWQPALFNNKPIDINVILKIEFSFDQHSKYIKVESSYFSQPDKALENSLYNEAVKLQLDGRINEAIKLYDEALSIFSDDEATFNRGLCKLKLADTAGACSDWISLKSNTKHIADKALNQYCNGYSKEKSYNLYEVSEIMPEFPGGENALLMFIGNQTHYPKYERENGISGTVYLSFIITKDGKLEKLKVVRGVSGGPCLSLEASRVILSMPKWKPGLQDGKPVNVFFQIPVRFTLR